jgi:small subunit ribosomal protein S3
MGQKVNPRVFRIGVIKSWPSKWFAEGDDYRQKLAEDIKIRKFLLRELREAGVDKIEIERQGEKIKINIHTAKPGLIIGRGGKGVDELRRKIRKQFLKTTKLGDIDITITELDRPNLSAQVVVQSMILDLEKRIPYRRVMKQALSRVERAGALGVKVVVKGRLNGAEIARAEKMTSGSVPLHTLRGDVDYARGTAFTTYGAIGVKVWIYRGEVFATDKDDRGKVIGAGK